MNFGRLHSFATALAFAGVLAFATVAIASAFAAALAFAVIFAFAIVLAIVIGNDDFSERIAMSLSLRLRFHGHAGQQTGDGCGNEECSLCSAHNFLALVLVLVCRRPRIFLSALRQLR